MILFRSMTPAEDGRPAVGPSARKLGVRREEVSCDADDVVHGGGMSVAPETPWSLPPHRRPKRLGRASTGPDGDFIFEIAEEDVTHQQLAVNRDADDHALVEGAGPCTFTELTARIERTRLAWTRWAEEGATS